VGGLLVSDHRVLLVRRATEPLRGQWSIPGGLLELGETLTEAVAREMYEETGLKVAVVDLVAAVDRIFDAGGELVHSPHVPASLGSWGAEPKAPAPRYHYVILDYLCEAAGGEARAGDDVSEIAYVSAQELPEYQLSAVTEDVIRKAFAMAERLAERRR
jgi:ADP-ribose pyrophosphatase YjhB (NUDIX family)